MSLVEVACTDQQDLERQLANCRALESGSILLFSGRPLEPPEADLAFLRRQRQVASGYHKNIVYRPGQDRVSNAAATGTADVQELRRVMRDFSRRAVEFAAKQFPQYARRWRVDYASFRPEEESGRRLSLHARNDLLHVDAFPTRPTGGDRILRLFTNINPAAPRVWVTGEAFEELAERFAVPSGLLDRASRGGMRRAVRRLAAFAGLPVIVRSPYDEFMLRFHHFLKQNRAYQESARKETVAFPPGSAWAVFTDTASHAVLSGRYALEQTFIVARESLVVPEKAPISILDRLSGARAS